ncbi:MAG TPA: putative maltokinase, partial [Candidatus Thermoplasmatota archaeon]
LDLSRFRGHEVIELRGRSRFPSPTDHPYPLVVGPHDMYWLELKPPRDPSQVTPVALPQLDVEGIQTNDIWNELLAFRPGEPFEAALQTFLQQRRWYRGKARIPQGITLESSLAISKDQAERLCLFRIEYTEGEAQRYMVPLALETGAAADEIRRRTPAAGVADLKLPSKETVFLYDPTVEARFGKRLADFVLKRRRVRGAQAELSGWTTRVGREFQAAAAGPEDTLMRAEQSNTSFSISQQLILKLFRTVDAGVNPDVEIGRFLTEKTKFGNVPALLGGLELTTVGAAAMTIGVVQAFVKNEGDAWQYTTDYLGRYLERALVRVHASDQVPVPKEKLLELCNREPDETAREMIGTYLETARLLGQRTGELHAALASGASDPDFAPEPFSVLYQRSVYQSMRSQLQDTVQAVRRQIPTFNAADRASAEEFLRQERNVQDRFSKLLGRKMTGARMRIHGDYHLGQVLWTGKDFCIIDFEGEPTRPLTQRRLKRSPLRDVAGMLRSFQYAFHTALDQRANAGIVQKDSAPLREWGRYWYRWVSCTFLRAYLATVGSLGLVPKDPAELENALEAFMLDKAVYELAYELNNRPAWAHVPLAGILDMLGSRE